MTRSVIVHDPEEFARLAEIPASGFLTSRRLPEQVFRSGRAGSFLFTEFENLFSPDIWIDLRAVTMSGGDEDLVLTVVDPVPSYFFENFGYYGMLRLSVEDQPESYVRLLAIEPPDSPADSFLYNMQSLACSSISKLWGLWADRELGVAIFSHSPSVTSIVRRFSEKLWVPCDEALSDIVALNFSGQQIPVSFYRSFRENYCG
jgi:hypothetical protein